jgi:hypothetical protein
MINDDVYETAVGAIELAARAPSIHNSQPWQCLLTDETLQLYAARDRWLPATDADRRDLMLSCGAMLHHCGPGRPQRAADGNPGGGRGPTPDPRL